MAWAIGWINRNHGWADGDPIAYWQNAYVGLMIPAAWFLGYQFSRGQTGTLVLCLVPPIALVIHHGAIIHRLTCPFCNGRS